MFAMVVYNPHYTPPLLLSLSLVSTFLTYIIHTKVVFHYLGLLEFFLFVLSSLSVFISFPQLCMVFYPSLYE